MSFHSSPFDYMASPQQAANEFSPSQTEQMVGGYLDALSRAVSQESFDPMGGVNALVFGEWGHGKSQVMYRTAEHLTSRHPRVLTIRIIAARLAPRDILEAAWFDLNRQPDTKPEAEAIRRALQDLGDIQDEDPRAQQRTAKALASIAAPTRRLHVALLFDEAAQFSGINFQEFLRQLERAFSSERVILHTMQCHSLATLDRARQIANDLGDWARSARQIHLPSIQQEEASEFFQKRLASRTSDPQLAEQLIPDGIARTLCAAAGGNPRRMLQYAARVWEACQAHGEKRFSGRRVLDVFRNESGVIAGTKLFMDVRFRRILDLLPQEWDSFGLKVSTFLKSNIDRLLGESEALSPAMLAEQLDHASTGELQKLTRSVGGLQLFEPKADEFDDTTYGLTHAFRSDLCGAFGSTGGLDLKSIQIKLLLKPREEQTRIADGLATVLQYKGYTLVAPKLIPLGSFPSEAHSHYQTPIRGFQMQVRIPDTNIDVPVLVTGLCGVEPPHSMIERIVRGIVEREWLFAYILYANEQLSWDDWFKGDEARALLRDLQGKASSIRVLNPSEALVTPSAIEFAHQPSVAAAIFFANIIGAGELYRTDKQLFEEMGPIIQGTVDKMKDARPRLSDVCYLPSDSERKILDHSCWEQAAGSEGLNLRQINDAIQYEKLTGSSLANLLEGGYLEKRGTHYIRKKVDDFKLFEVVLDVLKSQQRCSMELLVETVRGTALCVGGSDRLRANVEWIVEKLKAAGIAKKELLEFQFVDVSKVLKEKDQRFKGLVTECSKRISLIENYEAIRAESLRATLESTRKKKTLEGSPAERSERLDGPIQDLEQLQGRISDVEREIESEKKKFLEYFVEELAELKRMREALLPEWQSRAFSEEEYLEVEKLVEGLRRDVEDPVGVGTNLRSLLNRERLTIQKRLDILMEKASGRAPAQADDPYTQIVNRVLSRLPFDRLVVTVEEN